MAQAVFLAAGAYAIYEGVEQSEAEQRARKIAQQEANEKLDLARRRKQQKVGDLLAGRGHIVGADITTALGGVEQTFSLLNKDIQRQLNEFKKQSRLCFAIEPLLIIFAKA